MSKIKPSVSVSKVRIQKKQGKVQKFLAEAYREFNSPSPLPSPGTGRGRMGEEIFKVS
jgi:hypothetical protein